MTDPVPLLELTTPAEGWFYTLSVREAETAVARHGFALRHARIGYARRQPFAGSKPMFRLRSTERSSYLVSVSTSERDALVASGRFVYEGVLGHVAERQQAGTVRLMRWSRLGVWRLALEGTDLSSEGYVLDGPVGWVPARSLRAGAIYFGTWNSGSDLIINATKRVYGRDGDWWGGVRDYSGQDPAVPVNRWHWPRYDFSHLKPAIGFYDDAKPATLERHVIQAASAGLRYFSFYWYWRGGREQHHQALRSYLQARNRGLLDFGVQVCAHSWGDGSLAIPVSQFGTVAQTIIDRYVAQPNYVRANDGRPIVWLCDTRGLGSGSAADVRGFTDALRARAAQLLGEQLLIISNRDLVVDRAAAGIDGQFCSARFEAADIAGSYQRYVSGQRALYALDAPLYMRCVMSNFDERPRYPIQVRDPNSIRWFPDHTMDLFAQAARNLRDDVDASTRAPTVDNFALVYAWNEWHEGGVVEPNARNGCAYLDVLRREWNLTSGNGCIAVPPDEASRPASALVLDRFRASPRRFRVRASRGERRRVGTTFRFRLSRAAGVRISISRRRAGVRAGSRCIKPKRRPRRRFRRCDLHIGDLRRMGGLGANRVIFRGRLKRRRLRAGRYVASALATAGAERSATRRTTFRVIRLRPSRS